MLKHVSCFNLSSHRTFACMWVYIGMRTPETALPLAEGSSLGQFTRDQVTERSLIKTAGP